MRGERDRLTARLTDLELTSRGGPERIATLEAQLAEALGRAEAAGGDAAQTVRRLTETGRSLTAERTARQQLEARTAELDRQLGESRGAVETARRELAGLQPAVAGEPRRSWPRPSGSSPRCGRRWRRSTSR